MRRVEYVLVGNSSSRHLGYRQDVCKKIARGCHTKFSACGSLFGYNEEQFLISKLCLCEKGRKTPDDRITNCRQLCVLILSLLLLDAVPSENHQGSVLKSVLCPMGRVYLGQ